MDFSILKEKYQKEQTVLETQIESLELEIKNYRELAGVGEDATLEQIKQLSEETQQELQKKEEEVKSLISQLNSVENE